MKIITLRDLAAELGVTPAAVSLALRNHPRISQDLRRRAQALARERGYVPNPALARLSRLRAPSPAASHQMPLALILQPHPYAKHFSGAHELHVVSEHSRSLGYVVRLYVQDSTLPPARLAGILRFTGVEAVLLGPMFDAGVVDALAWDCHSAVAWEPGFVRPPCPIVQSDITHSIVDAVARCRERGYQRAGVVLFREPVPPVDHLDRRSAVDYCAREVADRSFHFDAIEILPDSPAEFARWWARYRPDVVIGQTELVYWWMKRLGIEPGRVCGFVTLHRDYQSAHPEVAGYDDDRSRTAQMALRLLDSRVRNWERGRCDIPQRMLLQMPWYEGRTLPPRSALQVSARRRSSLT